MPAERPLDEAALALALDVARGAGQVLDVGCGDGRVAARMAAAGARVTGVDPSEVALERARLAHPELELRPAGADGGLPFPDAGFDAVVCLHVLQHVADTQSLLSEVRRVLAPGGLLAVAVPWHGRVKSAVAAIAGFERRHDPLGPVLRFYTARSLRGLLDDFGFERMKLRGAGGPPLWRETLLARARRA